jgi:hypothetical protein
MSMRTDTSTVTFTHAFRLPGMEGDHPPGTYEVETDQEAIDSMSTVAYRRVATRIHLSSQGLTRVLTIDPKDLDLALRRDLAEAQSSPATPALSANPDISPSKEDADGAQLP